MDNPGEIQQIKPGLIKRPELLTYLCIISFIGSGLASLSNLFIFLSFDEMVNLKDEMTFDLPEFDLMMSGGKRFFLTGFILYTLSLFGAIYMWKLRKIGFHLYTVAQLFILILPVVMIPAYPLSWLSILVTGAFVAAYGIHIKVMK